MAVSKPVGEYGRLVTTKAPQWSAVVTTPPGGHAHAPPSEIPDHGWDGATETRARSRGPRRPTAPPRTRTARGPVRSPDPDARLIWIVLLVLEEPEDGQPRLLAPGLLAIQSA